MASLALEFFQPVSGGVFLRGEVFGGLGKFIGDGKRGDLLREGFCETGVVCQWGLDTALVEEAPAGAALRGTGDFGGAVDEIVADVRGKAGAGGNLRRLRRHLGDDAARGEPARDVFVDESVRLEGMEAEEGGGAGDNERVGEVSAVLDDAAAGPAADRLAAASRGLDIGEFSKIAEGDGGGLPAIDAEQGSVCLLEENLVHGHVEWSGVRIGIAQDEERRKEHREEGKTANSQSAISNSQ